MSAGSGSSIALLHSCNATPFSLCCPRRWLGSRLSSGTRSPVHLPSHAGTHKPGLAQQHISAPPSVSGSKLLTPASPAGDGLCCQFLGPGTEDCSLSMSHTTVCAQSQQPGQGVAAATNVYYFSRHHPVKAGTQQADYVACNFADCGAKRDLASVLKTGGVFVLNSPWGKDEVEQRLPAFLKRVLAQKRAQLYILDAAAIAQSAGLDVNSILQAALSHLSGGARTDSASLARTAQTLCNGSCPEDGQAKLRKAAELTANQLVRLEIPATWKDAEAKGEAKGARVEMPTRPVPDRSQDFREVLLGLSPEAAIDEARRCLSCKKAPCQNTCPAKVPVPAFIGALKTGDFSKALEIVLTRMPLPSVCGRICPHPCESKCVRAKQGGSLSIEYLKRAAADYGTASVGVKPCGAAAGKKVAVVGSGPAGLSVASSLARAGVSVTVFEQKSLAGGMLALCIPSYRLPRDALARDLERIKSLGVKFVLNTRVGEGPGATKTVRQLLSDDGFDAVFLGCGAMKPKAVGIPGEDARGVEHVLSFLESVNVHGRKNIGKKVLIIGAGYSAIDAARVARRLGAEACIVYRRDRAQMPASPNEVREAEEEGVTFRVLTAPVRIVKDREGNCRGLECRQQELGDHRDASGRPVPVGIAGSEFVIDCDMVVQATSQEPESMLPLSSNCSSSNHVTRVFAGGDMVTGPKTVIEAVAAGQKAAGAMLRQLRSDQQNQQQASR